MSAETPVVCRDCWPIATKKAEQEFNKTVSRWLTDISKEEPDSNLPRILPSLFHSPGGEKFRRLLFHFSTFVVKRCIKQEQGVRDHEIMKHPMLTPNTTRLSGVMRKAVMCNSIRHRKRFFTVAQESLIAHKQWKDYASELVKDYRKVSKTIRELEHQLRDARQKAEERATAKGSPHLAGKALAMKRAQHVQQVRAMWKEVEKFSSEQSAEKEVVESIFQSVNSQYQIDGREINLNVPELLLRKCQNEIQRRRVENTYEGGKLNLLSLLQLWNLSLHLYIEKLREVGVPELDVAPISTVVHTYHAQLANLETLKERLSSELIPNLRGSVDDVRSKLPVWESEYASPSNRQAMPMQLTIPSPLQISMTPDLSKKATPPEFRTRVTPKADANTPDTVIQLIDSVEKAARKSKSTHDRIHITRGQPKGRQPRMWNTKGRQLVKLGKYAHTYLRGMGLSTLPPDKDNPQGKLSPM
ncbi:HAUS augmin-like complex subunit 6 [Liolophura sinensis]|uniref:HAUS augmin-like complex subunit 6 n=1 Tax=Liolophura sinensis TaxID=3198878 RepID=UPI0031586DCF